MNPNITKFTNNVKTLLYSHIKSHKPHNNLTTEERNSIKNLQNNKTIIIKKADKSAGIVIMNRDDYRNKIINMLSDTQVYKLTDIDDTLHVKSIADDILRNLLSSGYITKKHYENLTGFTPKCPIFYGIPKIHKQQIPLRPIVSQTLGPTSRVSKYLDYILASAESSIPGLLKDTTAFLQKVESHSQVQPRTILATLDVVSLYTNIPQTQGTEFVAQYYEETLPLWNSTLHSIPPHTLRRLISFILTNTTFEFDNQYYTQLYGTTMGSSFAVKFANIYMYKWITHFENTHDKKFPSFTVRLVDDIFFTWTDSEETLLEFVNTLNNSHPTIKFELNYSYTNVNFLDTTVYIDPTNNTLHTKLFIKPTHKNQYLHFHSEHPYHVKKSIPYSQAMRLRRITHDDNIFCQELENLKQKFLLRAYPQSILDKEINKIHTVQRVDTLTYKTEAMKQANFQKFLKGNAFIPLIINYSSTFTAQPTFQQKFIQLWNDFLTNDTHISTVFSGSQPQLIYKKGITLQNLLIRANFTSYTLPPANIPYDIDTPTTQQFLVYKCNSDRCQCCTFIKPTSSFISSNTKEIFHIKSNMTCSTTHTIYLITCIKCKIQYIGQTQRQIRQRLADHKSNIHLQKQTSIGIHFNQPMHTLKHLTIIPIERVYPGNTSQLLLREQYWIKTLKTKYPSGLNSYPLSH